MMVDRPTDLPRYLPELPFPPYTYVPGRAPHPASPKGHLQGRQEPDASPLLPSETCLEPAWLRGIDLFNYGFYWEAHEVWEGLWKACGQRGMVADLIKSLIKLAACGVKAREGRPQGIVRHAQAARTLLEQLAARSPRSSTTLLGLSIVELLDHCESARRVTCTPLDNSTEPRRVFPFLLRVKFAENTSPDVR